MATIESCGRKAPVVNPVGWWLREDDMMMKATKLSLHHLRLAPGRAPSPIFSTDVSLGVHQQKYEDLVSTNDYSLSPKAAKAAPGLQLE